MYASAHAFSQPPLATFAKVPLGKAGHMTQHSLTKMPKSMEIEEECGANFAIYFNSFSERSGWSL